MPKSSSFLRHIHASTRHDPDRFLNLCIDELNLGAVTHEIAALLQESGLGFSVRDSALRLADTTATYAARTEILRRATDLLCAHFCQKHRRELYPVLPEWGAEPLAEIDRIAVPWLGVRGFGVHVNGFVRTHDGLKMWIAERAADRLVDPGKLDNVIGGGQPLGLTVEENLAKEAWEEAGVSADLVAHARPAGRLRYKVDKMNGLRNDTLFLYDLEFPSDFVPRNTDGEVGAFYLLPLEEVAEIIRTTDRFKFNCNLVIMDFLMRYGLLQQGADGAESCAALMKLKA